ncbi:MAG: 3'-5' exonuclease [Rubricoccaceae bacterium]
MAAPWLVALRRAHARRRAATRLEAAPLAAFLAAPTPDLDADWRAAELLALDLETTGLDPARDAILAVGFVVVRGGAVALGTARRLLLRPEQAVAQSAAVHGITDSAAARGLPLANALPVILEALAGRVLLGHHVPFDAGFLGAACRRLYGAGLPVLSVDTLALEARRHSARPLPEGALRLGACRARYGLPRAPAHDALGDALATAELFLAQAAHLARGERLPLRYLVS